MSDMIERQAAIDALDVLCQEHRYKIPGELETYSQYNEAWQDALDRAEGAIGNLPSAQPERKRGKWVYYPKASGSVTSTAVHLYPVCSVCGCEYPSTNYCPNCGADMRKEGGE